jgi:hypothetical protein
MGENASAAIPGFLTTPPSGTVRPPLVAVHHDLPFGELAWDDFEKLCMRLVRLEADVEHCQLYGTKGQKQEGIDIYARLAKRQGYAVYQCKRVAKLGPADIRQAVKRFLEGAWAARSSSLILCTEKSFEDRSIAEEFETQAALLADKKISLLAWDARHLSESLRVKPEIVNDFFGKAWLEAFLGASASAALRNRLDVSQVAEFREKLGQFYMHVFNTNDPGSEGSASGDMQLLPIKRRFILPDIEEEQAIPSGVPAANSPPRNRFPEDGGSVVPRNTTPTETGRASRTVRRRITIDDWLAGSDRNIILGGPGGGKSTLLRFLVTDLLSEDPVLSSIAAKWGDHLPVWVPFPTWTEKIRHHQECSLPELLQDHLRNWGEERLWPLVKEALEDERLLLVVDGLDEWVDEGCAKRAVDKLQVFVAQRNLPAVVASRPHGFAKLGWQQAGWHTANLASFTQAQQKKFAKAWFVHRALGLNHPEPQASSIGNREADEFVNELSANANLRELAGIPLLLRIFVYFRFRNASLPQNRFDAYERMVNQLISEHPSSRQRAANISESGNDLDADDIRLILSLLAFEMQSQESGGVIAKDRARAVIEDSLGDPEHGPGLDHTTAVRLAKRLLEIGQNTLGVLVERTSVEVGFFHRSFQEHLAANHVSRLALDEQIELVKSSCANTQWSEVILSLCYLTRRPGEVRRLVDTIAARLTIVSHADRYPVERLLAEIAFGSLNCPTPLARELAEKVFEQIELGDWMPQRVSLTRHALSGLRSTALREIVRERIKQWFPCSLQWRSDLLRSLATWEQSNRLLDCFWKNLHDEQLSNRRAAAAAIAHRYAGDATVGNRIANLARYSVEAEPRVTAIEALVKGWPTHNNIVEVLDAARHSLSPELRLIAVLGRIQIRQQTEDDLTELLDLASDRSTSIFWREDIAIGLISGWPGSERVKTLCLNALRIDMRHGRNEINRSIAEEVAIRGYPQDDGVADRLIARAAKHDGSFLMDYHHDLGKHLASNFRKHPKVSKAIDDWLREKSPDDARGVENSILATTAASETAKNYLLAALQSTTWIHWPAKALLETWGMTDSAIASSLLEIATGPANRASSIAHLIPQILRDPVEARGRLIELLRDPSVSRADFVLSGLQAVGSNESDQEVLSLILEQMQTRDPRFKQEAIAYLIGDYGKDPRVRAVAQEQAQLREWSISIVASTYPNDEQFASEIFGAASTLPVELRRVIVSDPSIATNDYAFALKLFGRWESEADDEVKTEAAVRYHGLKAVLPGLSESDLLALRNAIVAVGYDYEGRRQASLAGLIVSDRLDLLDLRETTDTYSRFNVGFTFCRNVALLRTILHHWEMMREKLGARFWEMLEKFESDPLQLWSRFCPFLWEYEPPRAEAFAFLSSRPERNSTPEILTFLAGATTHRGLLLEYVTAALFALPRTPREPLATIVAAEILGEEFGGDPDIGALLENKLRERSADSFVSGISYLVIALCKGWPESALLDDFIARLRTSGRPVAMDLQVWYLLCLKGSSEGVFKNFQEILRSSIEPSESWDPPMAKPLIGRVRRDEKLAKLMEEQLNKSPTASEKTTIPRILAAGRGASETVRSWAVSEIEAQILSVATPEMGVDYSVGRIRPVIHALLDTLAV